MEHAIQLTDENFHILFAFAVLWNVVILTLLLWRRRQRGLIMPKVTDPDVVFYERFASGSSGKSFVTRLWGASNCLLILITNKDVCITSFFPFTAFLGLCDLEHRIAFSNILGISQHGKAVDIEFRVSDGGARIVRLYLRKSDEFVRLMNGLTNLRMAF